MNYLINIILPRSIFLLCLLNFSLEINGLDSIYIYFVFLSIALILIKGVSLSLLDVALLFLITSYLTSSFIQGLLSDHFRVAISAAVLYVIFPLYWILLLKCKSHFSLDRFLRFTLLWVVAVAAVGLIQYYISPQLFGILGNAQSKNIAWSSGASLNEYSTYFRATSLLSSPQVYGLFTALYLFLLDKYEYPGKSIILAIVMISSLHSGNKTSFLIILLFIILKLSDTVRSRNNTRETVAIIMAVVIVALIALPLFQSDWAFINRLSSMSAILQEEQMGRITIYYDLITNFNLLLGEGPGFFTMPEIRGVFASESYLLQILIENGLLYLFCFLLFYGFLLVKRYQSNVSHYRRLALILLLSLIIVHAFTDPVFFPFWGVLLYLFCQSRFANSSRQVPQRTRPPL